MLEIFTLKSFELQESSPVITGDSNQHESLDQKIKATVQSVADIEEVKNVIMREIVTTQKTRETSQISPEDSEYAAS